MLNCYLGHSKIRDFYDNGHSGGVASTLGYYLVMKGFVEGVLVSKPYHTFIARTKNDFLLSCGSIYEDFKYDKLEASTFFGQIGKPCDVDNRYGFKICIFCSHVNNRQKTRITGKNRSNLSFFQIPLRCLFCLDHKGLKSDISVGDSHFNSKLNFILVNTLFGQIILDEAINDKYLKCIPVNHETLVSTQPYLYSSFRGKLKWSFTKIRKFL